MATDYSTLDRPYDNFLQRPGQDITDVSRTSQSPNVSVAENAITGLNGGASGGGAGASGANGSVETQPVKSSGGMSDLWIDKFIRSTNWKPKTVGFYIDGETGYAEFSNVYISGEIQALTGIIGGFTIGATDLSATSGGNTTIISSGDTAFSAGPTGAPTVTITQAGVLTASGAHITGTFDATSGTIGGFEIGADYIRDVANSFGLASTVTVGDDVRFWVGDTFANRATAPIRMYESGEATFTKVTISGTSTVGVANVNLASRGWTQTGVFSATDADTVSWTAGTFTSADGTSYSILAGATGNMTTATYIYLDSLVSTTVYQTTTTAATAVGAGKVLIAKAQNDTGEATFQVFGGIGGQNFNAASIVANSITANELSTSITYAGAIVIDTSGLIRSGQTAYDTGTGWFIGNVAGVPKLSIGNSSGAKITWDGTTLSILGNQTISKVFTAGEALADTDAVYIATAGSDSTIEYLVAEGGMFGLSGIGFDQVGQTFTAPASAHVVTTVDFQIRRSGSPTGNITAKLYKNSGGYPSGTAVATSNGLDVTTISTTFTVYTFTFSNDEAALEPGNEYTVAIDGSFVTWNGADLGFQGDTTSPTGAGRAVHHLVGGAWGQDSTDKDFYFSFDFEGTVAGRVYKTDANTATETDSWVGICDGAGVKAANVTVVIGGSIDGFSGLSPGSTYYLSDTQGAISTSAGTVSRKIGMALTATEFLIRQDNP